MTLSFNLSYLNDGGSLLVEGTTKKIYKNLTKLSSSFHVYTFFFHLFINITAIPSSSFKHAMIP